MSILVLNDVHAGVRRVGGTTQASAAGLKEYIKFSLFQCLATHNCNRLLIAGDLFDSFTVETRDVADVLNVLVDGWLNKGKHITLQAGNHDDKASGNKMSHFDLLCAALVAAYAGQVRVIPVGGYTLGDGWMQVADNVIAISHHVDQQAFLQTLRALKHLYTPGMWVVVHCNFDNSFAAKTDHSLNIDREMAGWITETGAKLLFAHEHQARVLMDGAVTIMGNQWPTSVADCLGNEFKYGHVIETDGTLDRFETWSIHGKQGFGLVDWKDLQDSLLSFEGFIRVEGEATAQEASSVMTTISRFRMKSKAFIVSNHVTIDGIAAAEEGEEQITVDNSVFNLMEFVEGHVTPEQFVLFKRLKESHDAS